MSIKCGNCKGRHKSVADVRGCHTAQRTSTPFTPASELGPDPSRQVQEDVIGVLLGEAARAREELRLASLVATAKLRNGHATSMVLAAPEVPAGRYAVEEEGTLKFFKVDKPTEGRWAGYTFVNQVVGGGYEGHETRYPVKNKAHRERILCEIGSDVQAAMTRYGKELGHCGHCGRQLTDVMSRARGIGPVCINKMGW